MGGKARTSLARSGCSTPHRCLTLIPMRTALALLPILAATSSVTHAQWTLQSSNTAADLRGIHSIGGGVAWASGTNGTVLRTEDGGYMWQSCTVPPGAEKLDFRGIQAFDANTAVVMSSGPGDLSRLYKTTDGCHSWKLVFTNPDKDGFWDAISADGKNLVILGDPVDGSFVFEVSKDGGLNWSKDELPPSLPNEGAFAASNSSLLDVEQVDGTRWFGTGGPTGARIFTQCAPCTSKRFEKNGWSAESMRMFGQGASAGIFSIAGDASKSPAKLVAVGGDYAKPDLPGSVAFSKDRFSWLPAQTPPHGYRSAVAYDPATKTWITVGPNGTDISTDDGKNWRALHPDTALHEAPDADRNWNALSLPFVVGPHGRIGRLDEAALKR